MDRDGYLLVGLIGALLSFIGAAYRFRGSIKTSAADDLWKESAAMRSALQSQLDGALTRVTALETRVSAAETRANELEARNLAHERQALEYRRTIDECQRQNAAQALTISRLEQQVSDLQTLVKTLQGGAA